MADERDYIPVELRRRSHEEQIEYLLIHFAAAIVELRAANDEIARLKDRVASLERSVPWIGPPKPRKPIF
jgi:hypothetical protein